MNVELRARVSALSDKVNLLICCIDLNIVSMNQYLSWSAISVCCFTKHRRSNCQSSTAYMLHAKYNPVFFFYLHQVLKTERKLSAKVDTSLTTRQRSKSDGCVDV